MTPCRLLRLRMVWWRSLKTMVPSARSATRSPASCVSAAFGCRSGHSRFRNGSSRWASGPTCSQPTGSARRRLRASSLKRQLGWTPRLFADRLPAKVSVGVVYVLALFMTIMDTTIVNVALPRLGQDFGVQPAHVDTVVVGYLVSLAVFMPASGWLGDKFGTRRVFLVALVVFTVASALCGQAQSVGELVAFRVLQGVGGGMLTPVGLAMLFRTFAPHERVRASRILIVPTAFAPALGPVLGGLLTTDLSWRWAFYINVPIGLFGLVFALLFVRDQRGGGSGRFDLAGFLLAGAGLGSLMFALSNGPARGWTSPVIDTGAAVGVVLLVVLVYVELRR